MKIRLNHSHYAEIDDADYHLISEFSWRVAHRRTVDYAVAFTRGPHSTRRCIYMHRLIADAMSFGDFEPDHKDSNGLNNRRSNLRPATRSQQVANTRTYKREGATSRFRGVRHHAVDKKWSAHITANGQQYFLGYHKSEIIAALTYNDWAETFFGEFARLNVIEDQRS